MIQDPPYTIFEKYGVEGIPANVVIGRNGKVVAAIEGLDTKALDAAVNKALAAK